MAALITIALLLGAMFAYWAIRFGYPRRDLPQALCYHKLSDRFCFEGTWLPPRRFLRQIDSLLERGYRFVTEEQFLDAIERPHPDNARKILLTFDDGYAETFDMYMKELRPRQVPVLVFLVTAFAGRENTWDLSLGRRPFRHLQWEQVEEMSKNGAAFGSHGASHRDLTALDTRGLEDELRSSKEAIESHARRPVLSVSYPFGRYNDTVEAAARAAGYRAGFTLYPHHNNRTVDRFALRRNGVYIIDPAWSLTQKLEPGPLYWLEEMKCRAINGVAVLTPLLKRSAAAPDR